MYYVTAPWCVTKWIAPIGQVDNHSSSAPLLMGAILLQKVGGGGAFANLKQGDITVDVGEVKTASTKCN